MSNSDISQLRAQLAEMERPSLKKTRGSLREAFRAQSLSEFRAAFAVCGMNESELGRHLGISRQYVNDMLNGRRIVQDWVLRAMPREARMRVAKGYVGSLDFDPPSASGWR